MKSTAERAILDVLTVGPNRVNWGRALNGICESDYSVVRLILQRCPCQSGDAVLQLAASMDGSNGMQVVTYDVNDNMNDNEPELMLLS